MKRLLILIMLLLLALCFTAVAYADDEVAVDNGIPVVYIDIDESQGTIEAMNADQYHDTKCYGTLSIVVPEGFRYSDMPEGASCDTLEDLVMDIKGRGNTSWDAPKKPYKIKLDKKADIFGLGENKHWVLLANAYDKTLLRNRITSWLGDQAGLDFTPLGYPVDVVMTGSISGSKYLGSYYLSEQVRVGSSRVDIDELDDKVTDPDSLEITGGYLLQNPSQLDPDSKDIYELDSGEHWATHTPTYDPDSDDDAYDSPAQQEYIKNYLQKVDDGLYSPGVEYREYMDLDSAAAYWLINQISLNKDAYITGSTYMYKVRDTGEAEGKLYWGPLWDFDYAWNFDSRTEGFVTAGGSKWEPALLGDKAEGGFIEKVVKDWPEMKALLNELTRDGGVIDQYYEETKASAEEDIRINESGSEADPDAPTPATYEERVEGLKTWIDQRAAWIDSHIEDLYGLVYKVIYVSEEEVLKVDYKKRGFTLDCDDLKPEKEGYIFTGWEDEEGNIVNGQTEATKDMTLTASFVSEEDAIQAEDIVFKRTSDLVEYNPDFNDYKVDYALIPTNVQDKTVQWTSSDESIATIDDDGNVLFYAPGTVTFKGTLKNGVSREFTLTIREGSPTLPESIRPETEELELTVGQQAGFTVVTDPEVASLTGYEYFLENEEDGVVTIDPVTGIITALKAGETKVCVKATVDDEHFDTHEYTTEMKVIVSEVPEPEPEEAVYTVVSGADTTWTKGSKEDVTITVKRSVDDESCFGHFRWVSVDGKTLVKDEDYTAVKGSTVVTIKASSLEGLSAGSHKVEVTFDDGQAEAKINIAAPDDSGTAPQDKTDPPKTGDSTNLIWFGVMLMAMAGLGAVVRKR